MRFNFGKSKSSFGQRRVPAQHWRGAEVIWWMGRRRRLALGLAYQSEVLVNCHRVILYKMLQLLLVCHMCPIIFIGPESNHWECLSVTD